MIRSPSSWSLADSAVHTSDTYNAQATAGDITKALSNHSPPPPYFSTSITYVDHHFDRISSWAQRRPSFLATEMVAVVLSQDARKCKTHIFFYLDFRTKMTMLGWIAPPAQRFHEYITGVASCTHGPLSWWVLWLPQDHFGCGAQAAKLVRGRIFSYLLFVGWTDLACGKAMENCNWR